MRNAWLYKYNYETSAFNLCDVFNMFEHGVVSVIVLLVRALELAVWIVRGVAQLVPTVPCQDHSKSRASVKALYHSFHLKWYYVGNVGWGSFVSTILLPHWTAPHTLGWPWSSQSSWRCCHCWCLCCSRQSKWCGSRDPGRGRRWKLQLINNLFWNCQA